MKNNHLQEKIIECYKSNLTSKQVKNKLQVTTKCLRYYQEKLGFIFISNTEKTKLLIEEGKTNKEIIVELGISKQGLSSIRQKLNLVKHRDHPKDLKDEIFTLLVNKRTKQEIVEILKCSLSLIDSVIKNKKFKRRAIYILND